MINNRYEVLLQDHVQKAFKKARFSSMIFALSDSVNLLCMALTFYYGGRLLASREYEALNFFVVYIAVINGAESGGSFLSFGPSKWEFRNFNFNSSCSSSNPSTFLIRYHRFCASITSSESNSVLQS